MQSGAAGGGALLHTFCNMVSVTVIDQSLGVWYDLSYGIAGDGLENVDSVTS